MHILTMVSSQAPIFNVRFKDIYPSAPSFPYDPSSGGLIIPEEWWSQANVLNASGFAPTVTELKDYAANKRYIKETSGITVSGMPIATDRQSQAMLLGAFTMGQAVPGFTTKWKMEDGSFVTVDTPTLGILAMAVAGFISSMFQLESNVDAAITNGTITTFAQIDTQFV